MVRALAAGAVLALAASTAVAGERIATTQPHEADLGPKKDVAPDAALGGSLQAPKAKKAEPGGPTLDFETFRKVVEVQVSEKRREEIASLRRLIDLGGGSATETPQWYFRLAELLWEESQYYFFEANRRDDRLIALGTRGDPREIDRLMAERKEHERQAERHKDQAVALYKAIIAKYPKYPRLDEVLYFLAESLSKRNRNDPDALKAYRALIQKFPQSRYVPDAWMAFGEYYFEKANASDRIGNLRKALEAYRKAASYQESSVYGYAIYKQGWVHYNLNEWTDALELFKAVIFFGELPTSTVPADRKLALIKEARKDYVRTYSHIGSAEAAPDEFKRVGGDKNWSDMLKTLGGIYYDEGKDRDAIVVHHRLIQEKPLSPEAPLYQSRIVTSAGRMGRKDAAVQQAHVFVKMLRDIEAQPGAKDEKGQKALADARREAEQTLRILAVQYHNEWKKTRDEPVAAFAAAVYRDYLDLFPNEPTAYEMRFFHAELRYALADFEGAGEEYEHVARLDIAAVKAKPPRKPGKFFKDALENAVFAWDLVVKKVDEQDKLRQPADPRKRLSFAPQRQRLVDACKRYLEFQPKGDKWVEVAYKVANLYYRHNDFAEATDLFTRIALDHPAHELAAYSTNLVLDAYNLLGDWRNVNGWAKRFYANAELLKAHPALKDDLAKVIEQSAFKVIEEKERARDHEGAAEEYLAFVREWPQSRLAPTALFNASVDYVKVHRLDKAVEVRAQLLQRFPADPLAPKVLYDNAEAQEAMAEFARSADLYERYFEEWRRALGKKVRPKDAGGYEEKKANDAIVNVAVFRAGLREWVKAEAASRAYLETWPNGSDASRLFLSLADLYAKQGQTAKELRQLEDYQRRYAKDPDEWLAIQHRIAQLLDRHGRSPLARKAYSDAVDYWKRRRASVTERGLPVVAQGMYEELEPAFAEYDRITLNVAPKHLKGQLQVKGKKLKALEESYGQVVKLKQAEPAVCALYRIGLAYRRFAQTLFDTPIPRELRRDPELVQEYKAQLAQVAEPLDQKAFEGLGLAVNASRDYGVQNDCSRQALALLAKHKPEEWGPSPEVLPAVAPPPAEALAPRGYGLLSDLQPVPPRERTARRGPEASLPPLRVRTAGTSEPPERRGEAASGDPQLRAIQDEPVPVKKKRKKGQADDDEDLLP
ncbi:MAG TPA: tetratricopeptide repeat protein [Anaeromyxobacter sp.]|nr:tetratricopeptide repeat protein [Anaeromyxobacter sp.]